MHDAFHDSQIHNFTELQQRLLTIHHECNAFSRLEMKWRHTTMLQQQVVSLSRYPKIPTGEHPTLTAAEAYTPDLPNHIRIIVKRDRSKEFRRWIPRFAFLHFSMGTWVHLIDSSTAHCRGQQIDHNSFFNVSVGHDSFLPPLCTILDA
jgi:hypothetical protein